MLTRSNTHTPELDNYRWLVSAAAEPWLQRVQGAVTTGPGATGPGAARPGATRPGASAALLMRLRKDLSAARAHLVVEQVELRERACDKFALAERMFFTRKGLEQATDEQIAAHKAARFPAGSIADLCCGMGGDAIAMARRAKVAAVDQDDIACLLADANARVCSVESGRLRSSAGNAAQFPVEQFAAWHIDPDRRPQGSRTSRVDLFHPPLAAIEALLARNGQAAIKLAPAADAPDAWLAAAELQWLGSRGECRQQVAWFGSLARHAGRRAATIVDAAAGPRTIIGEGDEPIPAAAALDRYLYEPHNAVLAAHLTGALCREHALAAVSGGIAYLTNDSLVIDPALAAFEVREVLPFDLKQLKAWCREHRIGCLEVKKRGVEMDPEKLRKAIISDGDESATLIVTPVSSKTRVIVAKRLPMQAKY